MLASYHGHLSLVRLLLQHGADPNTLNDRGQSPLAGAVFKNEEEIIRALLVRVSFDLVIDGYFRSSVLCDERSRIVRCVNGEAD
jgi:ankyrin repeat protein